MPATYSRKTIATPPGATIREQLEDRGMTQKEFAQRMDMSEKHISRLINGEVHLTPDVALRLEHVLGLPAQFWNNLEARYREKLARAEAENAMDADIELAKKIPYAEMVAHGWAPKANSAADKVNYLRRYFEVARLGTIEQVLIPGIAYRRTTIKDSSIYALAVWAQRARLLAVCHDTAPINLAHLQELVPEFRRMTLQTQEAFYPVLVRDLSDCGIALVLLPHMEGSFLQGATFYDGKKIVMGLTLRGRDADRFWFSLFHEIAHIVKGHIGNKDRLSEAEEKEADRYAADTLIPPEEYNDFVRKNAFTDVSVRQFAQRIEVAPGIIVGRLQKDRYIEFNCLNGLKLQYTFPE